jgi:hypothetical protein
MSSKKDFSFKSKIKITCQGFTAIIINPRFKSGSSQPSSTIKKERDYLSIGFKP